MVRYNIHNQPVLRFQYVRHVNWVYRILRSRRDQTLIRQNCRSEPGDRPYISQLEHGKKTNVSVEVIEALAIALDVSPTYLLGYSDNPTGEPDAKVLAEQSESYVVAEGGRRRRQTKPAGADHRLSEPAKSQQTALLGFIRSLHNDEGYPVCNAPARIIGVGSRLRCT